MNPRKGRRLALWELLRTSPMTVREVAAHFRISREAANGMLRRMQEAGEVMALPTVPQLAEQLGVSRQAIHQRLRTVSTKAPRAIQYIATAVPPGREPGVRKPRARNGDVRDGYGSGGKIALEQLWGTT